MKSVTAPGAEAQVDYGEGPMVRDRGERQASASGSFVLTLGCIAGKSVRLLAWKSSSRVWAELHERAFRQLGGVPRVVVLDNLREGVITTRHLLQLAALNPLYRDVPARSTAPSRACPVSRARPR